MLYECFPSLYDDWYWMFACVAETRDAEPEARRGGADAVSPRVVTNDAMRDHWQELLPARSFARWRHSQVSAFGLTYQRDLLPTNGAEGTAEGGVADGAEGGQPSLVPAAQADEPAANGVAGDAAATAVAEAGDEVATQAGEGEDTASSSLAGEGASGSAALSAWVAKRPLLTVEAQHTDGGRWHVPIPQDEGSDPRERQWLCFTLPEDVEEGSVEGDA